MEHYAFLQGVHNKVCPAAWFILDLDCLLSDVLDFNLYLLPVIFVFKILFPGQHFCKIFRLTICYDVLNLSIWLLKTWTQLKITDLLILVCKYVQIVCIPSCWDPKINTCWGSDWFMAWLQFVVDLSKSQSSCFWIQDIPIHAQLYIGYVMPVNVTFNLN